MLRVEIPGRESLAIAHVVLDFNGTIAVDGLLADGVADRLVRLNELVHVHVLTADTYGTVRGQCEPLGLEVETFPQAEGGAAVCKARFVAGLHNEGNAGDVCCIGNGFNDIAMFDDANLSIAVLDAEGACAALIAHASILARSCVEALDLLLKPDRLRATLRT